jgi:hypothetical protein
MSFVLKAVAPTVYQYNAVSFFGGRVRNCGGAYVFEEKFESREDAIDYLHRCIDVYAQTDGDEQELINMRNQADCGYLTYDHITCRLIEIEEFETEF